MKKECIEVTLNPDGTVQVEAHGYVGNSCEEATRFLEEALGLDTKNRKAKPERYATTKQKQRA